jgi:hypothetical protein
VRVDGRATFPSPAPPDSLVCDRCVHVSAGSSRAP